MGHHHKYKKKKGIGFANNREPAHFDFTLSGFIFAIITIALVSGTMGAFMVEMGRNYGVNGTTSFDAYNKTSQIFDSTQRIKETTAFKQEKGAVDIVGNFLAAGWASINIALESFDMFDKMMDTVSQDVPELAAFSFIKDMIVAMVVVGLFIGVVVAFFVKQKI